MAPRENKNNAYAKFGCTDRVLRYFPKLLITKSCAKCKNIVRFKRAYVLDQANQILASKIIARYQHHTQQLLYKN